MLTFPNAKINIGLNITAKRNDGYHDLETVFYPIGIQDVLEIKPLENSDKDWDFQIAGQQVTERPEDNLVIKVFKDLQKEFDLPAVDIYLQKKIPTGAGLGGGQNHQPGGGGDREPGGLYLTVEYLLEKQIAVEAPVRTEERQDIPAPEGEAR